MLRARTPAGVTQEIYALLITYQATCEPNAAQQRDAFTRAGCWKVLPDQVTG